MPEEAPRQGPPKAEEVVRKLKEGGEGLGAQALLNAWLDATAGKVERGDMTDLERNVACAEVYRDAELFDEAVCAFVEAATQAFQLRDEIAYSHCETEIEQLIPRITDPSTSIKILMLAESADSPWEFTDTEKEHLASNIESDPDSVLIFFMDLVESGVLADGLNETETWLVRRLRNVQEPAVAEYIRYNVPEALLSE